MNQTEKYFNIEKLVNDLNNQLFEEFGVKVEDSKYYLCNDNEWNAVKAFCGDQDIKGVYIVDFRQAFVPISSLDYDITFLHEYFGHGLFTEKSFLAQREGSLKYSMKNSKNQIHNLKNIASYGFFDNFFDDSEAFAVWMSYFLSKKRNDVERFYNHLNFTRLKRHYNYLLDVLKEYESVFTSYGVFKKYGIDVNIKDGTFLDIVKNVYEQNFEDIRKIYLNEKVDFLTDRKKYEIHIINPNFNYSYTLFQDCWIIIEHNPKLFFNKELKCIYSKI
ncbi:MAG: hypothetical protein QXR30_02025 [Candidatus Woesearchaeota archaeon]